jgi:hypothetical protein
MMSGGFFLTSCASAVNPAFSTFGCASAALAASWSPFLFFSVALVRHHPQSYAVLAGAPVLAGSADTRRPFSRDSSVRDFLHHEICERNPFL